MLDLDRARADRARRRSIVAQREGAGEEQPIIFGGAEVARLPAEAPLSALAPLRKIDQEIALLLREAVGMAQGGKAIDGTVLVVDLIAANPNLPTTLIDVVREMAEELLGSDGLKRFLDARPSIPDAAHLAMGVLAYYGLDLGEASRSSDSQTSGGPTSDAISSTATTSTPEGSGSDQETPDSSA